MSSTPANDDRRSPAPGEPEPSHQEHVNDDNDAASDVQGPDGDGTRSAEREDSNEEEKANKYTRAVFSTQENSKIDLAIDASKRCDEDIPFAKIEHLGNSHPSMFSEDGAIVIKDTDAFKMEKSNNLPKPSFHSPQQRPRSLSPLSESEDRAKRPAIICDFYAKGWCIKGHSCRFLHGKDGIHISHQRKKGEFDGAGAKGEFEGIGLVQEVQGSRIHSEHPSSSGSNLLSTRLLVREFGGMHSQHQYGPLPLSTHGPGALSFSKEPLFGEVLRSDPSMHVLPRDRDDFHRSGASANYPRNELEVAPSSLDDYSWSLRVPSNKEFVYRKYTQPLKKDQVKEYLHEEQFRKGSPFALNEPLLDYKHLSSGSSSSYENNKLERTPVKWDGQLSYHEYLSSGPSGSSLSHSLSIIGASSTVARSPLFNENPGVEKFLDGEKRYYPSRSSSLSQSASCFKHEGDIPVSVGFKASIFSSNWEPSLPFQSSFVLPADIKSSPENQYDPLVDCLESSGLGIKAAYASSLGSHEAILRHTNGVNVEVGGDPGRPNLDVNTTKDILGRDITGGRTEKRRTSKEEKRLKDGKGKMNVEGKLTNQADRSRMDKEPKALKIFRARLVDFVKELVKPSWHEGNLSKDAHKTVVRKAVDKVLSSLQSHQIPSTNESINQYLSSSRPKLSKLVEGYVEKYAKARAVDGQLA